MTEINPNVAVCPGSYDPITNGHLDIIRRASQIFDEVVVGVVRQSVRKEPLFSVEERVELIEISLRDIPRTRVESFDKLLVEFAIDQGAGVVVKGLRAISDFEYEFEMNQLNRTISPEIETVFLMSSPQHSFISSSGIKELAQFGGKVDEMVPSHVAVRLQEALRR